MEMTREEAIEIIDTARRIGVSKDGAIEMAQIGWWKSLEPAEIVAFQLYEPLLCMDFGDYHKAVEDVLGRSVWTHEFAYPDHLKREFEGKKDAPGFAEILELIPEDKRVIIAAVGS